MSPYSLVWNVLRLGMDNCSHRHAIMLVPLITLKFCNTVPVHRFWYSNLDIIPQLFSMASPESEWTSGVVVTCLRKRMFLTLLGLGAVLHTMYTHNPDWLTMVTWHLASSANDLVSCTHACTFMVLHIYQHVLNLVHSSISSILCISCILYPKSLNAFWTFRTSVHLVPSNIMCTWIF